MLFLFVLKTISGVYTNIAKIPEKYFFRNNPFILTSIFYLSGEPLLLGGEGWRLRCSPGRLARLAIIHSRPDLPSFMGHFLAAAAIFARE